MEKETFYQSYLTLRAAPLPEFLAGAPSRWPLTISTINEDRLLRELGLPTRVRNQIEGLHLGRKVRGGDDGLGADDAQLASNALLALAHDPPSEVGKIQRLTSRNLMRPCPHGLRFSGNNMNPLPGWLTGGQSVAMNMSNVDLGLQMHFALFNGTPGYLLKPPAMITGVFPRSNGRDSRSTEVGEEDTGFNLHNLDDFWPPPRESLYCATIEIHSLFCCPKDGEQRLCYEGRRSAAHKYHPELSGSVSPPDNSDSSSPVITWSLHTIGGFCAACKVLPLPLRTVTTLVTPASTALNGMNAEFGQKANFIAAEPHATFLTWTVANGRKEIGRDTAVLGRLQRGYRVLRFRSELGTRIELCCVLVRIRFAEVSNLWPTNRQNRLHSVLLARESALLEEERIALSRRGKIVADMCDSVQAELVFQTASMEWSALSQLRPSAAKTAIEQLETRLGGLAPHESEWYDDDAQLTSALTMAVDAKTAASSWPRSLAMLQARSGLSSLEEVFEADAMTVQAHRNEEPIGPEGAYGTCALLLLGSKLQEINLPGCRLGAAGAEALSHALMRNTMLRVLSLAGSRVSPNVGTAGAMFVCMALESNASLTKLSLADNSLDGRDHKFKTALHRALQRNRSLVEVDFRYNRSLGWAGADAVIDAKAPLRRLNMLNTAVGVERAETLAMLEFDTLCGLSGDETDLQAQSMALDSGDAVLLMAELSRNGLGLITIDLSHNQLKDDAVEALTRAMRTQDKKNLSELLIGGNFFSEAAKQELEDVARLKSISLTVTSAQLHLGAMPRYPPQPRCETEPASPRTPRWHIG